MSQAKFGAVSSHGSSFSVPITGGVITTIISLHLQGRMVLMMMEYDGVGDGEHANYRVCVYVKINT
jgi:hypothetical protein